MNAETTFKVDRRKDDNNIVQDTLIKIHPDGTEEAWTTVGDLDRLFDACSRRWSVHGWDLNKLITAVNECDFD